MRVRRDGVHWKIIRISLGVALAILGVLGLFPPVLQGILFLVLSLLILSVDVPVFRRLRRWLARRFPAVFKRRRRKPPTPGPTPAIPPPTDPAQPTPPPADAPPPQHD